MASGEAGPLAGLRVWTVSFMRELSARSDCCGLKQQRLYVQRQKRLEIGGRSGVWKELGPRDEVVELELCVQVASA